MGKHTGNELVDAKARLSEIEKEIADLREYISTYTGYLKMKYEVQRKLLRRIKELESEDA
jgi:hypothetical protein